MSIMQEADIVYINGDDGIYRIFAPKASQGKAEHRSLSIPLEDLFPMDWLVPHLMEVKVKDKTMHFIIIVNRFSGFVTAHKIAGRKTH